MSRRRKNLIGTMLLSVLAPAALGWSPSMAPLAPMAARSHIIVAQQPAEKMEENVVDELRSELRRAQLLSEAQALVIEQTSDSSNLKQELAKANQRMRDLQVQLSNERSITNELETALESTIRTVEAQDNELDEVYNDLHQVEADLADALKQLDAREPREPEVATSTQSISAARAGAQGQRRANPRSAGQPEQPPARARGRCPARPAADAEQPPCLA